MSVCGLIDWFDSHANTVTALSTVLLAFITACYAALTYLLLREQRRQASEPRVARTLIVKPVGKVALRARNLGPGTAVDVALRSGPSRTLPDGVTIENLGTGNDLGATEERIWPIEWDQLPHDALSLVITYHDRNRKKIWFDVFQIRFVGVRVSTTAGWSDSYSAAKLKRKILANIPMRDIPRYLARHWSDDFDDMLVEDQARRVLARALRSELEEMLAWGERYESVMEQL